MPFRFSTTKLKRENMKKENKNVEHGLSIIDEIEKVRSKNNVNWMDVSRLAFKSSPDEAKELVKKIDVEDTKISELLRKLSE